MSRADHPVRSVISRDGAVLLDVRRGTITTFNPTGAFVWQELERGQALDDILLSLSELTGQDRLTIEQDVHDFIQVRRDSHLLSSDTSQPQ